MLMHAGLAIDTVAFSAATMGYFVFRYGWEEAGTATSLGLVTNLAAVLLLGPIWPISWAFIGALGLTSEVLGLLSPIL